MEWITSSLGLTSSSAKEGLDLLTEGLVQLGSSVYSYLLEQTVLPVAGFILKTGEEVVRYSLNGDYQRYEEATAQSLNTALSWLQLSAFQIKLIWEFFLIILGNSFFVFVAWRWYGDRIRSKFMGEKKNTEEIRVHYGDLKLPEEMDFKFK